MDNLNLSKASRKLLKQMLRESKPEPFEINGKIVYFNPLKKILNGEMYKSKDGIAVTQEMVHKYEEFLKAMFEKRAKELKNGAGNTGNESKAQS